MAKSSQVESTAELASHTAVLDNPWQTKPWWCQPWSIVLTGGAIVGGSWLIFHLRWLTGLVALPIGVWMGFFLILWPRLMRSAIAIDHNPDPSASSD